MGDKIRGFWWELQVEEQFVGSGIVEFAPTLTESLMYAEVETLIDFPAESSQVPRTGLQALFPHRTETWWLKFWIDSPLTPEQCAFLIAPFEQAIPQLGERWRNDYLAFLEAMRQGRDAQGTVHVERIPPGHVDLGYDTVFPHCPSCKSLSPIWYGSGARQKINCPECGFVYIPEDTRSIRQMDMSPLNSQNIQEPSQGRHRGTALAAPELKQARQEWQETVEGLQAQIEEWSWEQGWSFRRIPKQLQERVFGHYTVDRLLLRREDNTRLDIEFAGRGEDSEYGKAILRAKHQVELRYLPTSNGWHLYTETGFPLRRPWNAETFAQLLTDLLGE